MTDGPLRMKAAEHSGPIFTPYLQDNAAPFTIAWYIGVAEMTYSDKFREGI